MILVVEVQKDVSINTKKGGSRKPKGGVSVRLKESAVVKNARPESNVRRV
jgi:hypothetical protein